MTIMRINGRSKATEHVAAQYRDVLRWPVGEDAEGLVLGLGRSEGS